MIEQRGTEFVVVDPTGSAVLFRAESEELAEAFVAGFNAGFDDGEERGRDDVFDGYACFDQEGNGPIISARRMHEICESNARALAERSA